MTKTKSTKRALLSSIVALVLCCAMLVGTTFAWFTDSVTSKNNIIKAGNLDVELYYQVEGQNDWTKVGANTNVFMENALWEPGHTEVVKLKVVNEGSLALKYQLGVNVDSETGSVNVLGENFKLSDFIKYGIVDGAQDYTRDEAIEAVDATATTLKTVWNSGTTTLLVDDTATEDVKENENVVTMVVYMPAAVGNEANYAKGEAVPTINLGINLFATQVENEEDSFGADYDEGATIVVSTPEDLQSALNIGVQNISIEKDMTVTEPIVIPAAETSTYALRTPTTVIDLNGNTITTAYNENTKKHAYAIDNYGNLNIVGGTIEARGIYNQEGATLTVDGTKIVNLDANGGSCIWSYGGSVVLNDATLIGYTGCVYSLGYLEINGGTYTCYSGVLDDGTQVSPTYTIRSYGELLIKDGDFTSRHGLVAVCDGTAEINDGTYTMTSIGAITSHVFYVAGDNSVVTVNGGEFNCDLTTAQANGSSQVCVDAANVTVNICGGTFNHKSFEKYVATGFKSVKVDDLYYVIDEDITPVYSEDTLANAIAEGGELLVMKNFAVNANNTMTVANAKDVTLDLNGKKITATADKTGNQELFLVKGNMTVKNGAIELTAANNQGWGAMATIFDVTAGGALNMKGVDAKVSGTDMNFIVHLNNWGAATAIIDDCDFELSYVAVRAFNSGYDMNTVTIKNTDVTGGARLFWVHNYTSEGKDDTTLTLDIYGNNNTSEHEKPIRFGFSDSIYFDIDGKKFVVATTLKDVMAAAKNGNVIIDAQGANLGDYYYDGVFGNGTVLKNATFTYVYGASVDGVATFENCNFVSDHSYSANFSDGSYNGKVIFNNCVFDGWSSFGDAITGVEMNNCTFEWNNPYSMLRFYQDAVLNNCNFVDIDGIDTNKTGTVVKLNNCTGIEGKIYNNGSCVGTWIVDGTDISDTVTSW